MRIRMLVAAALLLFVVACQRAPAPTAQPATAPTPTSVAPSAAATAQQVPTPSIGLEEAMAQVERPEGAVAANVNGTDLSSEHYLELVRHRLRLVAEQEQIDWSSADTAALRSEVEQQVLEQMIDMQLLRDEAQREGLLPTPEEVSSMKEGLVSQILASGQYADWEAFKTSYQLTDPVFDGMVEESILLQKMMDTHGVVGDVEQVHAQHILVADEATARDLLARIKAGEDFSELAKQSSLDTGSAEQGGDLGWFPRTIMVPAFEEAAFALQPGEVSDVVATDYGFHIIKVLERGVRAPEAWVAEQLQEQVFTKWLLTLRDTATIVRNVHKIS